MAAVHKDAFFVHCTGYIYRTDATGSWIRSSGGDPRRQCCAAAPPSPASRVGLVGGGGGGAVQIARGAQHDQSQGASSEGH